jgi:hypothetical protein
VALALAAAIPARSPPGPALLEEHLLRRMALGENEAKPTPTTGVTELRHPRAPVRVPVPLTRSSGAMQPDHPAFRAAQTRGLTTTQRRLALPRAVACSTKQL